MRFSSTQTQSGRQALIMMTPVSPTPGFSPSRSTTNQAFEQARFNMVEQQIRTWDVLDQDVLDLLYVVRREEFVPPEWKSLAFFDLEIPLTPAAAQSETTALRSGDSIPGQRPSAASSERMW